MKELYLDNRLFTGPEEEFLDIKDFGFKTWYQNGKLHRIDGPAVIYYDGEQYWYQDGNLHRTDGPAEIWPDGIREWYMEGVEFYYFFDQFFPMQNFIKDKYPGE